MSPYNQTLATHGSLEHMDGTIFVDNQKLYEICERIGHDSPNFADVNKLIAHSVSSVSYS